MLRECECRKAGGRLERSEIGRGYSLRLSSMVEIMIALCESRRVYDAWARRIKSNKSSFGNHDLGACDCKYEKMKQCEDPMAMAVITFNDVVEVGHL